MRAGVDNECNTATLSDTAGLPDRYREALERGLISARAIHRALVRLFAARHTTAQLAGLATTAPVVPPSAVCRAATGELASGPRVGEGKGVSRSANDGGRRDRNKNLN